MEVLNDQLIDLGLNVLGYLIAGALGMLVYSTLRRRATAPVIVSARAESTAAGAAASEEKRNLEFVSFRKPERAEISEVTMPSKPPRQVDRNRRADRAEIVRLAREMMKAGAPGDTIRRTLPISEGELALLQIGKQ